MKLLTLAIVSLVGIQVTADPIHPLCKDTTEVMPPIKPTDEFNFAESGLQIFTDLEIPCEGNLVKWSFLTRTPTVERLHLVVFRRVGNTVYQNAGETYIDTMMVPDGVYGSKRWLEIELREPIQVRKGDHLGLYYDQYEVPDVMVAIASKELSDGEREGVGATLVLLSGTGEEGSHDIVDAATALVGYRYPALKAIVVPQTKGDSGQWDDHIVSWPPNDTRRGYPGNEDHEGDESYEDHHGTGIDIRPPGVISGQCELQPFMYLMCEPFQRGKRSFYDYRKNVCIEYLGCPPPEGYANNFDSFGHCLASCHGWNPLDVCSLRPRSYAICKQTETRFYYDPIRDTCDGFDGCGVDDYEKGNNFGSLEECNICIQYAKVYGVSFNPEPESPEPEIFLPRGVPPAVDNIPRLPIYNKPAPAPPAKIPARNLQSPPYRQVFPAVQPPAPAPRRSTATLPTPIYGASESQDFRDVLVQMGYRVEPRQ